CADLTVYVLPPSVYRRTPLCRKDAPSLPSMAHWNLPSRPREGFVGHAVAAVYSPALAALVSDSSRCVVQFGSTPQSTDQECTCRSASPLYWHPAFEKASHTHIRVAQLQTLAHVTYNKI